MRQTSKWGLLFVIMLVSVMILAACSGGGNREAQASTEAATAADPAEATEHTASEEGGMRKVDTAVGEIELPANPQRIVADWNVGHLLALDITPIAIPHTLLEYGKFLRESIPDTVADLGDHNAISLEQLTAVQPDLIITFSADKYEAYSKVAPTLVFDTSQYETMQDQITALGEYLNRQDEAAAWNADFDKRLQAARAKVQAAVSPEDTFTLVDYNWEGGVLVLGNSENRGGSALYKLLGLKPDEDVQSQIIDKGEESSVISWEVFDEYVGTYLLELTDEAAEPQRLQKVWSQLDAVKNDRRIELDLRKYFTADPFTAILQAEDMADLIVAKAEQ
ncbi:ABC transporter substrate-binding protein [Saccharibacillus sacchari]|uniref:ABC transporter substrate-binding protein n=1 Tax=Saccharibacillus sacchari TaxID=456493 RepID=UPI0004BAE0F8|nr:ABC transporter substrate-binding protein [Saccharibacillus sacchari]